MASSAVPIVFPTQTFDNVTHMDGGLVDDLDLGSPLKRCYDIVDKDEDIIVDIIMPDSQHYTPKNVSKNSAFENIAVTLDISRSLQATKDTIYLLENHPNVTLRYVIQPEKPLES